MSQFNVENKLTGHKGAVSSVSFSPRGRFLASAGADGVVIIWNAKAWTPQDILAEHTAGINGLAWLPHKRDRFLLSVGDDRRLVVWDGISDKWKGTTAVCGHDAPITVVDASDNGLFTGDSAGMLVWWTVDNTTHIPRPVKRVQAHSVSITSIRTVKTFPHVGTYAPVVITAGLDGIVRMWHQTSALQLRSINIATPITAMLPVVFSRTLHSLVVQTTSDIHILDPLALKNVHGDPTPLINNEEGSLGCLTAIGAMSRTPDLLTVGGSEWVTKVDTGSGKLQYLGVTTSGRGPILSVDVHSSGLIIAVTDGKSVLVGRVI
ncbi:WD domain, G-beta repeat [Carpediemonas membranifera]|uniref:WD domain, G-beta repeat n=1 Tax=Carpediemonas membranifera TaxID=201153 RepID=A0A8J6C199_9EUKA|nr:WD domain, G-beta repeat [Carpediemonas membranifera]|eukprot:KAG9397356.1 WD domain, G-beta repeat [Carpediemonas membranifera]